jgi:hypothetical protein
LEHLTMTTLSDDRHLHQRPARRRGFSPRALFRRLTASAPATPGDADPAQLTSLDDVYATVQRTRVIIEHGWVQHRWLVLNGSRGASPGDTDVAGACLVGALIHANGQRNLRATIDTDPAIDVLWDAWQELRGARRPAVTGKPASRDVRATRVRDLTRWNDQPGRTRAEVLELLDLAASHVIMAAAGQPGRGRHTDRSAD